MRIGKINSSITSVFISIFLHDHSLAEKKPYKALSEYPTVERIWMGLEESSIRPANFKQIRTTTTGNIILHAQDGTFLNKQQKWCTIDPDNIDLEKKGLSIQKEKLTLKIDDIHESHQESLDQKLIELEELHQKKELLEQNKAVEISSQNLIARINEAIQKIDQKITSIEKKTTPDFVEKKIQLEIDEAELQLETKENAFTSLLKRSVLKAPFDGTLHFSENLREEIKTNKGKLGKIWLEANQLIATISDKSRYEIVITPTNPIVEGIPTDDLAVLLKDSHDGKLIRGEYSRIEEISSGSEITQNYIFTIPGNSIKQAKHRSGQRHIVHIYRKLNPKCHLVHKKDISFIAPDVLKAQGWSGLVKHLWPKSKIKQVGPQTIAILESP